MKIVRTNEVAWTEAINKGAFVQRRKPLGGEQLACGLWELPPGKKSFPFHKHHVTEEAMYVVSGKGQVRSDDGLTPIGPGDFVSFPVGGSAHQVINDGSEPLVYLGISAPKGADVVEYPDSGKVAASVGSGPNRTRWVFKDKDQVEYFADEKDAS